eukprot:CAMPEP_0173323920 /NCGR_PEP_ID=MMETSP1143-20121109/30775_1 /TAXON_ID=483371 /ORGANISM="non described non described, Strain CCMP2298" /LENGTH=134 /DNA_ID=CAMNT_0014267919 /DNA_START=28 /DNA_END=430 /DNA_ORIENTATION=+
MSYYGAPIARQGSIAPAAYGRPSFAAPAYGAQNCGPCGPQRGYAQARPAYGYPGQQRYAPRYIDDSYYYSEEAARSAAPAAPGRPATSARPAPARPLPPAAGKRVAATRTRTGSVARAAPFGGRRGEAAAPPAA